MIDAHEVAQDSLFYIEGPDERGCVWMHGANSREPWSQNLGRCRKVAEILLQCLGSVDSMRSKRISDAGLRIGANGLPWPECVGL